MATYFTNSTQDILDTIRSLGKETLDLQRAPLFKDRHKWRFTNDDIAARAAAECGPLAPTIANPVDDYINEGDCLVVAVETPSGLSWTLVVV